MLSRIKQKIPSLPTAFWVLIIGTFIDRLGGYILTPFYSLFVATKFDIQMTQIGLLFSFMAMGRFIGGFFGGALTDKVGRKFMFLFGLIVSGLNSILIIFINDLRAFYLVSVLTGILGAAGGPAQQALVADILRPEDQAIGYGVHRVAVNIGATLGPIIGGLMLVSNNFNILFVIDAIMSCVTALIVIAKIPETNPNRIKSSTNINRDGRKLESNQKGTESFLDTLKGYGEVLKDSIFTIFVGLTIIMQLVYMQMYSTLSVYLLDFKALPTREFGWIMSGNALAVVILQVWISKRASKHPPLLVMALGMVFYGLGFTTFGFTSSFIVYFIAMQSITIGEMLIFPVGQGVVARLAPEDKRGRYMAIYMFGFIFPSLIGNLGAGLIYDNIGPVYVWYVAGALSVIGLIGFLIVNKTSGHRLARSHEKIPDEKEARDSKPQEVVAIASVTTLGVEAELEEEIAAP